MISTYDQYLERMPRGYFKFGYDAMTDLVRPLAHPFKYMHYYYPLDDIAKRVFAETAMIGKHRMDANGNNQFDRYALSEDEEYTFKELALNAANDAYEKLIGNSSDHICCFNFDEGDDAVTIVENRGKKITINSVTQSTSAYKVTATAADGAHRIDAVHVLMIITGKNYDDACTIYDAVAGGTQKQVVEKVAEYDARDIVTELSGVGVTASMAQYTASSDFAELNFNVTLNANLLSGEEFYVKIKYKYTVTDFMGEEVQREGEYLYERAYRSAMDSSHPHQFNLFAVLPLKLDKNTASISGIQPEAFVSLDDYSYEMSIRDEHPRELGDGQYVRYHLLDGTEKLYVTKQRPPLPDRILPDMIWMINKPKYWRPFNIPPMPKEEPVEIEWTPTNTNDDIDDALLFAHVPVDFTHSIHYITKKYEYVRENAVHLTDNAIKNCIVFHIIFEWLQMVAPEGTTDLEIYANRYNSAIDNLKLYIGLTNNCPYVAHPF